MAAISKERTPWLWIAISASVGMAVEIVITQTEHRREAWDSRNYWIFGMPAMMSGAFVCGFFARRSCVSIGYAPFLGQLVMMAARIGVGGSMLPIGLIFMGIIGLSGVLAAFGGAAVRGEAAYVSKK